MHPTPPQEIRTPPPRFPGDPGISRPGFCGARSPIHEWARCAPRRRTTIWGTWPPNLSALSASLSQEIDRLALESVARLVCQAVRQVDGDLAAEGALEVGAQPAQAEGHALDEEVAVVGGPPAHRLQAVPAGQLADLAAMGDGGWGSLRTHVRIVGRGQGAGQHVPAPAARGPAPRRGTGYRIAAAGAGTHPARPLKIQERCASASKRTPISTTTMTTWTSRLPPRRTGPSSRRRTEPASTSSGPSC